MSKVEPKWTIVQHSGFGYGHNPEFAKGLEPRVITTKKDQEFITKAGGLLFDSYLEADDYADLESAGAGLIPNAPGSFAEQTFDGLRIYIPKGSTHGS